MPARPFRPNEISAGGVIARPAATGHEVCLVSDGTHWGLPKGIVEQGELPEDAALREISEETGLHREVLSIVAALPTSDYVYRRRDDGRLIFKRVLHYLVSAPAGAELQPDPAEIAEAVWLDFDAAISRASFRDTRDVLAEARRLLVPGVHDGSA